MENRKSVQAIADLIIFKIEQLSDKDKWKKPWISNVGIHPYNFCTNTIYRGFNRLCLLFWQEQSNFATPCFLTFKQAQKEKLQILRGSKSFPVQFFTFDAIHKVTQKRITMEELKLLHTTEQKEYVIRRTLKVYNVFNLDQTNIKEVNLDAYNKQILLISENDRQPEYNKCDNLIENWECPIILKNSGTASYSPLNDVITMPTKKQFTEEYEFYSTLIHEVVHSTGHSSRLNRNFDMKSMEHYGREELIAEFSTVLIGLEKGLTTLPNENNLCYMSGWLKNIKEDPRYLVNIIDAASKAEKYILKVA